MKRSEKIERLKDYAYTMFPNAETELYYNNNFQLLIAILMSAQATDIQVNKVNTSFFEKLISPSDGICLGIKNIEEHIKSIPFFRNKARFIFETSHILQKKYNSIPPKNITELLMLPGVGIKTAKVFLAVSENAPLLGVDTHVHRVLNRTGIVSTKSPLETDKTSEKIFKSQDLALLHNTLIFFGRYHCIARNPKCGECRLNDFCRYYTSNKKAA